VPPTLRLRREVPPPPPQHSLRKTRRASRSPRYFTTQRMLSLESHNTQANAHIFCGTTLVLSELLLVIFCLCVCVSVCGCPWADIMCACNISHQAVPIPDHVQDHDPYLVLVHVHKKAIAARPVNVGFHPPHLPLHWNLRLRHRPKAPTQKMTTESRQMMTLQVLRSSL
jgi:hypothetical protein